MVVTDGKNFGRAWLHIRVESLDVEKLTLSDVALNSILRDASWVVREATSFTPAPIIPEPLVSKGVQFLPFAEAELNQNKPLSIYFEIYEPVREATNAEIFYRMRITDLKTDTPVMDTEPISAADYVVPGSNVGSVGLKLDTSKLATGFYRLEVQASDSAGHESEWRSAKFKIQ